MTIKSGKKFTYEDYLKIDDGKQYELIEEELKMVPAPSDKHQNISLNLCLLLATFVRGNKLGVIRDAPLDVILDKTTVVQPDLVFISKERTSIIIENRGVSGPPDLVIEIISKGSKYADTYKKKDLYEKFGIKEYWLVDPFSESIEVLVIDESKKYELFSEGFAGDIIKSNVLSGLEISVEEVFKKDW
jgi:Uma2 family endonuclease